MPPAPRRPTEVVFTKTRRLTVRLPEELVARLEAEARLGGETLSETVRRLLAAAFEGEAAWRRGVDEKLDALLRLLERGAGAKGERSGEAHDDGFEAYVAENAALFLSAFEKGGESF